MKRSIGWLARIFGIALAILPMRVRLSIGDTIGILWFDVLRIRRSVALANVRLAFPEKSSSDHAHNCRNSLRSMGRTLVEFALFPYLKGWTGRKMFAFEGLEHLDRAFTEKKGVIMLTLHMGNGDMGAAGLSIRGYKMNLISKEFKSRWLNDLWFGMRRKLGTKFISPEKSSFEILRALKRNEAVIFVLDQFMGPPVGTKTRFFGTETGTAMGCALMALRTGVPVVPCYDLRCDDGTHKIVIEPPIPTPTGLDDRLREENIAALTQVYTDKIETIVRRHPEQWMWIHRRWKEFRD
ncbi:MAG: lysophospholipid acyltransferase family protein [Bdellovibrionota bacterium]